MPSTNLVLDSIDLKIIANSGQCFRWQALNDSEYLVHDGQSAAVIAQTSPGEVVVKHTFGTSKDWCHYLDGAVNYKRLNRELIAEDARLEPIIQASLGLRMLRQDPLEVLMTFMMSANNHIPRIRQFMYRLCETQGAEIGSLEGQIIYSFPSLEKLATLSEEDFKNLGTGYRARYMAHTFKGLAQDPEYPLWPELDDQQLIVRLMRLMGVGQKVADCVALFGYGRMGCFPVDTWIKQLAIPWLSLPEKVTDKLVLSAFTEKYGKNRGLVQQYLFYYYRLYGGLK